MFRARNTRALLLATTVLATVALPAASSTTHYFYDATGRYVGQTSTGSQIRSNAYDAADNRQSYQVLVPTAPTSNQGLGPNQSIFQGQILTSGDGVYSLSLQEDGNVVLYHSGSPIWGTGTGNTDGATLIMQGDGNLVLYDAQWRGLWSSGTGGNNGATLSVQTDGNLVIYTTSGQPIWASNTAGR